MTVTVYVDWEERRVLNKKEFEEEVDTLVENINGDHYERNERIEAFLDEKELYAVDLFEMSNSDRQALVKEFGEWLTGSAREELLENSFGEVEVEL